MPKFDDECRWWKGAVYLPLLEIGTQNEQTRYCFDPCPVNMRFIITFTSNNSLISAVPWHVTIQIQHTSNVIHACINKKAKKVRYSCILNNGVVWNPEKQQWRDISLRLSLRQIGKICRYRGPKVTKTMARPLQDHSRRLRRRRVHTNTCASQEDT